MSKLTLGPLLYFWDREQVFDFYKKVAEWPVDVVYLGEVICSKRRALNREDWLELAAMLKQAGKEVVLSTLVLIEADSELRTMHHIADNDEYLVETNEMAAVQRVAGKKSFIAGPHLNCYNHESMALLNELGAKRWVMPVELGEETLQALIDRRPAEMEVEVFAYGRLPLAFSARCFTARAEGLPKDDCQLRCGDYAEGLLVESQDGQPFLDFNGIQTQSAATSNLIAAVPRMVEMGVDMIRLSPQHLSPNSVLMAQVVNAFAGVLNGSLSVADAEAAIEKVNGSTSLCNGFWYGEAGMDWQPGEIPETV
ncbi:MAG: U32 family peptidase [Gammaproteobacteria bacterium]|nr:U32 family peptidase [Gammaproteobacteria bacterium]